MNVHSGQKQFQCPQCQKRFMTKYHLNRHSNTCPSLKKSKGKITPKTNAELGLSIAKKRIMKQAQQEETQA